MKIVNKKKLNKQNIFNIYKYIQKYYLKHFIKKKNVKISSIALTKDTIIYMLKSQLIRRMMLLGYGRRQTAIGYYSKLQGFYKNAAQINIGLLIYHLRRNFRLMLVALLKNYRFCFVTYEQDNNYKEEGLFLDYHSLLKSWPSGAISNFKWFRRSKVKVFKRLPQFVVVIGGAQPYCMDVINKEAYKAGLQVVNFLDSNVDLVRFQNYIPINTKTHLSITYCFFLISVLLKRSLLIKKLTFLRRNLKRNVFKKANKN